MSFSDPSIRFDWEIGASDRALTRRSSENRWEEHHPYVARPKIFKDKCQKSKPVLLNHIDQDPPTGHQLRPVRVQQPSTNSLLEGAGIDLFSWTNSKYPFRGVHGPTSKGAYIVVSSVWSRPLYDFTSVFTHQSHSLFLMMGHAQDELPIPSNYCMQLRPGRDCEAGPSAAGGTGRWPYICEAEQANTSKQSHQIQTNATNTAKSTSQQNLTKDI